MEEENLRQGFFISDDGYINLRLKVTTEDKKEREELVRQLMGEVYNSDGSVISKFAKFAKVDKMYYHKQDPLTVLKDAKSQAISAIDSIFDEAIERR